MKHPLMSLLKLNIKHKINLKSSFINQFLLVENYNYFDSLKLLNKFNNNQHNKLSSKSVYQNIKVK